MIRDFGERVAAWSSDAPWTNVYGIARSLLALGTLLTLAFSPIDALFRPAAGMPEVPVCSGVSAYGWFCLMPASALEPARWGAVALLAVIASGWRPRWTGVLHWWLSVSFMSSAVLVDGGDHVTAVLTFLLIPLTLTDGRTWHWASSRPADATATTPASIRRFIAHSARVMIRLQVAVIYFHSSVGKMYTEEWASGTALYYWFTDPILGAPDWLAPIMRPFITSGTALPLLTWGVILFELLLFLGLVLDRKWWRPLLIGGLLFHTGIALTHGLISFVLAMFAALLLFLRPWNSPFSLTMLPFPQPLRSLTKSTQPSDVGLESH